MALTWASPWRLLGRKRNWRNHIASKAAPPELRLDLPRQFGDARRHCTVGIGQRIDHGIVVGAGDLFVARLRPGLPPGLRDGLALALEFARFEPADDGVKNPRRRKR